MTPLATRASLWNRSWNGLRSSTSVWRRASPPSLDCSLARASLAADRDGRPNVRQYFGPALRVDFGSVALASLRLTRGRLRREHVGPVERTFRASRSLPAWLVKPSSGGRAGRRVATNPELPSVHALRGPRRRTVSQRRGLARFRRRGFRPA